MRTGLAVRKTTPNVRPCSVSARVIAVMTPRSFGYPPSSIVWSCRVWRTVAVAGSSAARVARTFATVNSLLHRARAAAASLRRSQISTRAGGFGSLARWRAYLSTNCQPQARRHEPGRADPRHEEPGGE